VEELKQIANAERMREEGREDDLIKPMYPLLDLRNIMGNTMEQLRSIVCLISTKRKQQRCDFRENLYMHFSHTTTFKSLIDMIPGFKDKMYNTVGLFMRYGLEQPVTGPVFKFFDQEHLPYFSKNDFFREPEDKQG
jgi:hypothetical protein